MARRTCPGYVRAVEAAEGCGGQAARPAEPPTPPQAARFSLIYESRDGRLCLFEDADGHLTSVDADRFA